MRVRALAVAIHDVEPLAFERCRRVRAWLADRGVERATLLVIPAPRLHPFDSLSPALAEWLRLRVAAGDAVAQHGLRHLRTRPAAPLRALHARASGGSAAEFAGLDGSDAAQALDTGYAVLVRAGLPPTGFVAPAYLYTPALRRALAPRFGWWADRWGIRALGAVVRAPALCLGTSSAARRLTSRAMVRALGALARRGPIRLDVHPADFDHPGHVELLERVLDRASDLPSATYDGLVASGGAAPGRAASRSRPRRGRSRAAAAAPPRRR